MKILLVEDEVKLGRALQRGLEQEGYVVELVHDGEDGMNYALNDEYDLVILDRMLPDGRDGLEICRALRDKKSTVPILVLTARDGVPDRVEGLNSGADDYLIKPFALEELLARVRALTRRTSSSASSEFIVGDLKVSLTDQAVERAGEQLKLSRREFSLLEYLFTHPKQTLSKEQLIDRIWGLESDILPNTVEVSIKNLRHKLGDESHQLIETIHGFGYRFNGE